MLVGTPTSHLRAQMMGVALSRKIMVVAGDALRSNITRLGPKVLPWSEQIKFGLNLVARLTLTGRLPIPRGEPHTMTN